MPCLNLFRAYVLRNIWSWRVDCYRFNYWSRCLFFYRLTHMDDEEILQMVVDGELDASEVDDFKDLNDELQEMVSSGEVTLEEATELNN